MNEAEPLDQELGLPQEPRVSKKSTRKSEFALNVPFPQNAVLIGSWSATNKC